MSASDRIGLVGVILAAAGLAEKGVSTSLILFGIVAVFIAALLSAKRL